MGPCATGEPSWHQQVGHPLGVPDVSYAGEVALGVVLADPTGELTALQGAARHYPALLSRALVRSLWEAQFCVTIARKAAARGDAAYVAGCLFRSIGLCAHALHANAARWLINEKGAIAAAGKIENAPADFTDRAQRILGAAGTTPAELMASIDAAARLVDETAAACEYAGRSASPSRASKRVGDERRQQRGPRQRSTPRARARRRRARRRRPDRGRRASAPRCRR